MALLFNNLDTKAENTTAVLNNAKHSFVMWFKAKSFTTSGLGRFVSLGTDGQFHVTWNSVAGTIEIDRSWSVTSAIWSILAPSHDNTTWIGLGITYDGSLTTNNPVVWTRALGTDPAVVSRGVTTATAPSGIITALANGYNIGNRSAADRAFDGDIAYAQIWIGTILTQAQVDAALNVPGSVAGASAVLALTANGTDSSGNGANATISGTTPTFESGPPGIPTSTGPTAALTGTAASSIAETDITGGGKTIILTLSGTTWVA